MRTLKVALRLLAWVALVGAAVVICVRAAGLTGATWEVRMLAVSPLLVGPLLLIVLASLATRSWVLVACSVLLTAVELVWIVPVDKPWSTAKASTSPERLVIFDQNISQTDRPLGELVREIRAVSPDVVGLEELTPTGYASLRRSGIFSTYRYQVVAPAYGAGGVGLWSRLPLSSPTIWEVEGSQREISASAKLGARSTELDVFHVFAPVGFDQPRLWKQQLAELDHQILRQGRPLIVMADLNATVDMPPFRHLLSAGLDDAAVQAGKGWQMTWPDDQVVPPYLRIDHVLLSAGLTTAGYRLGPGSGSDHKSLIVSVAEAPSSRGANPRG